MLSKNYKYNPFSGVLEDDIENILVPNFNVDQIIHKIKNSDALALEFLGKMGRGKTTHLVYLQKQLNMYPIFLLNHTSTVRDIMNDASNIVFIDSIHHLNFLDRIKVLKQKKVVIYTTHWSRKLDCILSRKKLHTIKFKGINENKLLKVINKRLQLAALNGSDYNTYSLKDVQLLIQQFGDNYRGIINHLYEKYQ